VNPLNFILYRGPYDGAEIESALAINVDEVSLAFVPGEEVGSVVKIDPTKQVAVLYAKYVWTETDIHGNPPKHGSKRMLRLIFVGYA